MNSNSEITIKAANLAQYGNPANLIEIRRHPELYPRIGTLAQEDAVKAVMPFVYGAFLYRGQAAKKNEIRFIAFALVSELMADTKWGMKQLSLNEIGYAIRNAVLGETTLYGVSVASLYNAILDYLRHEGHEADRKARQTP